MEELANNLPAGYVLDDFSIREVLGAGTFGITYCAYDNRLQMWVAIKEFLPSEMAGRGSDRITVQPHKDASDKFRFGLNQFLEEARTLARFKHANIVRVTRHLEANGTAYMVMEYVQGQSLYRYLKIHPTPVSESLLKAWFIPILNGLMAVHAAGFLHRDIKPGNIYLRDDGEPVLIDFGAARQAMSEHSKSVTGIFTPGYAPTEQYGTDAKKQGPWTDLYSVGATLYRCISDNTPIDAPTRQSALVEGDPDPLVPARVRGVGQYSPAFLELIDKLLVLLIKDRPQTTAPVLAALKAGKSVFETDPRGTTGAVLPVASGISDAATVVVSDRHQGNGPRTPVPPKSTVTNEEDEPLIKNVNPKALGVVGALLILGILVTVFVSVQKNSLDIKSQKAAPVMEQTQSGVEDKAAAEANTKADAQMRAQGDREACANDPTCMVDTGGDVLLNPATGLEWTQTDNGGDIGWSEAMSWCQSKGDGWRLPSAQEFASIYDSTATIAPLRCGQANCFVSPLFQLTSPFFWRIEVTQLDSGATQVGFFAFNEDLESQPNERELTNHEGLRTLCVRRP